jgi:hypothetical protein
MKYRVLGRSSLEIAPLAFGGNVFGWTADEAASFRLLDRFAEAGFNLIDTADVYSRWVPGHSGGESETIIGRWLKQSGKRDRVIIATKLGMDLGNERKGLSAARARDRCGELLPRAIRAGPRGERTPETAALRDAPAALQFVRSRRFRSQIRGALPAGGRRGDLLFGLFPEPRAVFGLRGPRGVPCRDAPVAPIVVRPERAEAGAR